MEHQHESHGRTNYRANIAWIVFLAIAAFFLLAEDRAHLAGWLTYWPYLLVLACPLMHLFMHGGHGHGSHGSSAQPNESTREKE